MSQKTNEAYAIFGMGLLGSSMYKKLSNCTSDYRLFAFDRARVDVTCRDQVRPILEFIKPTTVLLCAGMFDAEDCEVDKDLAHTLNTLVPSLMAEECKRIHAKIVFFSTAMVYENKRQTGSSERTKVNPINVLGKTKLDGENAIKKQIANHLIIRPGTLFSEDDDNILKSVIDIKQRGLTFHSNDQRVTPTYVDDMANGVIGLIQQGSIGVFNLGNKGSSNITDFFSTVFKYSKLNTTVDPLPSFANGFFAPRPQNQSISIRKFEKETGFTFRSWEEALKDCLSKIRRVPPNSEESNI